MACWGAVKDDGEILCVASVTSGLLQEYPTVMPVAGHSPTEACDAREAVTGPYRLVCSRCLTCSVCENNWTPPASS